MKVKILRSTIVDRERVEAGTVLDLSPSTAHLLAQVGKAELLEGGVVRKRTTKSNPRETIAEGRKRAQARGR